MGEGNQGTRKTGEVFKKKENTIFLGAFKRLAKTYRVDIAWVEPIFVDKAINSISPPPQKKNILL